MERRAVLLLFLLAVVVQAGPLTHRRGGCAQTCPKTDTPNPYTPGKSYTFNYATSVRSHIRGASEESTGLRLTAKVVVDVLTRCDMALRMEGVRVSEQDPAQPASWVGSPLQAQFDSELAMSDVHFAVQDGRILDVCAEVYEPEWVLNIKKAVISLLQNTNPNKLEAYSGVETDISGTCKVAYRPAQEGADIEVIKVTDLMSCPDQQRVRSSFQSSSYRVPAQFQSMPLTKANRTCRIAYDASGRVKTVQCSEEHVFRPFSTESAGATTQVEQKLEFVGAGGMVKIAHDHTFRRSRLEYQHHDFKLPALHPVEDVKSVLNDLCDLGPTVTPQTPKLFNELIHRIRALSTEQLTLVRAEVDSLTVCRRHNQMARQFFFDALPVVSTTATVEMMKALVLSGKISTTESELWLTSLAFIQNPSREMLESLRPLLEVENPSQQAQLGIGALVYQFCQGKTDCPRNPVVKSIGAALGKILGKDCSSGDRKNMLTALKAVGNAGYLTDLMPVLVQCVNRENNLMDVRVAAIDALRRTPCSEDRTPLMKLVRNKDVDSELRITAYLGLMACPSVDLFDTVKELLTAESSNQFASFMWTHLTNLLETSDPHKQNIRQIVEDVKLKKQYDMDKLKFSRNVEKSFFSKYLNAGAKMESNLVWSQRSFLPRSATLNMTLDLFGKSFNFFEIGGRVQGLETLLEKYLGPKGMERKQETDTSGQLAELDKTFKVIEDEIGGSLDIKIFGHQIAFLDLWKENLERSRSNVLELLNSLKQMREVSWQKSFSFIDTKVTIPTISGFPLVLGVNGTASFVLKSSGKLNLKKLTQWPPEVEIEGKLSPSGTVHVSGALGIETVFGDYGVKMVANVHSSTEMQVKVKTQKGEDLHFEIQQPRERQNILNTKTSFFVIHRSVEREQNMRQDLLVKRKACSSGTLMEKVLGVEFCAEMRYPAVTPQAAAPLAPLAAGFEIDLSMLRRDTHTSYLVQLINKKNGIDRHWMALVDTPGSQIDRKLQAEILFDSTSQKIEATLTTPWKKGKVAMSLNTESNTKTMRLSTELDGVTYASAVASYKKFETEEEVRHEVEKVELRYLNSEPVVLRGMVGYAKLSDTKKWEMTFNANNLWANPVAISGSVAVTGTNAIASASVNTSPFSGKIESRYDFPGNGFSGSTSVTYRIGEMAEESVNIQPTFKFSASAGNHDLKGSVKCVFSGLPQYSTHIAVVSKRSAYSNHEMDINVEYGRNGEFVRFKKKITTLQSGANHEHALIVSVATKGSSIGVKSEIVHDLAWTKVSAKLAFDNKEDGSNKFITKLEFSRQPGTALYTASIKSQLNEDSYAIVSKLQRQSGALGFETTVTLRETEHVVMAELQQDDTKHRISCRLSLPGLLTVRSELNADTSSSEPSFSATVTTPSVKYAVNGSAKLDSDNVVVEGQITSPGVNWKAQFLLKNEADDKKITAELYWNPRRSQSDGVKIDGFLKGNRRAHSLEREGKLLIEYPTDTVTINLKENNEHLKTDKYIEMTYANGKKVSANFMYDINDGWTEKGIKSMLRLVTPISRYEVITLKLDGYGSLRVRRLEIETSVNERRFKAELLVNLGNINNFNSRLSIVTPWAQASFMKFELTHWLTSNEIKTKLDMEFKTKKMILEMHGYNKGGYSNRDAGFKLQGESTFSWMPKVLLDLAHKDDGKQFSSNAAAVWNDDNAIALTSKFNFYPQYDRTESRGNITLTTPFKGFEIFSTVWDHKNSRQMISTSWKTTYQLGKSIDIQLDGYDDLSAHKDRQIGSSFSIRAPFMEDATFRSSAKYSSAKFESSVQLAVPYVGNYKVEALATVTGPRFHLKIETPHQTLARFGLAHASRKDSDMETSSSSEIYWNTEAIRLTTKLLPGVNDQTLEVILQTPFEVLKHERLLVQVSTEDRQKATFEFSHNLHKVAGFDVESKVNSDGREFKISLETPFKRLQSLKASALYAWLASEKAVKATITYNSEHSLSLEVSSLNSESQHNLSGKVSVLCPSGNKKLILTHNRTPQQMTTHLTIDAGLEKAIVVKSVISPVRGGYELEVSTPFAAAESSKVGVLISKENNLYKSDLVIQHVYYRETLKLELESVFGGMEKASLKMRLATPAYLIGDLKATLNHQMPEMGKWRTSFEVTYPGGRIDISSELSTSNGDINGRWQIRTPFAAMEELGMHMRHRTIGRLIEHQHGYKMIAAGNTVEILNSLRLLGLQNIKVSSQFNSNILGVERIIISAHQTAESAPAAYDGAFSIDYGTTKVAAGLDWKVESSGFEGSASAKLPLDMLKNFNATVRLRLVDWMRWTSKSKISVENSMGAFQLEKEVSVNGLTDASGNLKLRTPVSNWAGNLRLEMPRDNTLLVQSTSSVDGQEKQLNMKLEKLRSGNYRASLKVTDQPMIVAENKWKSEDGSAENVFSILVDEKLAVGSTIRLGISNTKLNLSISTRVFDFKQDSSIETTITSDSFNLNFNHQCNWMTGGPVHLKLEAAKDFSNLVRLTASATLKTPYFADVSGNFAVDIDHFLKGKTLVDLRLPNTDRISGNVSWNLLTDTLATVQIQLPYIQSVGIKMTNENNELKVTVEMPKFLTDKWELRVGGNMDSVAKVSLRLYLQTTVSNFEKISVRYLHNFEDESRLSTEVEIPGWSKNVRIEFSSTASKSNLLVDAPGFSPLTAELFLHTEPESYDMKLIANWNTLFGSNDLEVKTKLGWNEGTTLLVDVKAPVAFVFYDDAVRFRLEGDLQLKPTVTVGVDLQFASGTKEPMIQLVKMNCGKKSDQWLITLTLPVGSIKASHSSQETTAVISWLTDTTVDIRQKHKIVSPHDFEIETNVKYSTNHLTKEGQFHVRHQGSLSQFRNKVSLKVDQTTMLEYSGQFTATGGELKAEFEVKTPTTNQMTIRVGHKGGLHDFSNYLDLQSKYHTPLIYKGQFKNSEGDFSASVPMLGESRMQIRHDGSKYVISMSANSRKLTVEVEHAWKKMAGRTTVKLSNEDQLLMISLKNEGEGRFRFMTELTVQAADITFDTKVGYEMRKSVHFSAQLTRLADSTLPLHSVSVTARRDNSNFLAEVQLVKSRQTLFELSAKHEWLKLFSFVVKTNRPGFRQISLVGTLTDAVTGLEFTSDWTRKNVIKLEIVDKSTGKLVFDSEILGVYSVQLRSKTMENSRFVASAQPEIEIRWPNSDPVVLRLNYQLSTKSVYVAVNLVTPFESFKDNKVNFNGAYTSEWKMMSLKISQDTIGNHGFSIKVQNKPQDMSGSVELESDYAPVVSKLTWKLSAGVHEVKFNNQFVGLVRYSGKTELASNSLVGTYTLEAPIVKAIGVTSVQFQWLNSNERSMLKLKLNNPYLGENELSLYGENSEVDGTDIKHTVNAMLHLGNLNEKLSMQSTLVNGRRGAALKASGSHSLVSSRFGTYSINEDIHFENGKVHVGVTVHAPIKSWDKTALSLDVETKEKLELSAKLETKQYGVQSLALSVRHDDLAAHVTFMSARHELTIAGWRPKVDQNGFKYLDFIVSVNCPNRKASTRLEVKNGKISIETSTAGSSWQTGTAMASATWELKTQRVLLDMKASLHVDEFNQAWGATCDFDFANENVKRLVLKLEAPASAIKTTELSLVVKVQPMIDASLEFQSPYLGQAKAKAMWQSTAPVSGKFSLESTIDYVPSFELAFGHIQKHENLVMDLTLRNLATDKLLFRVDSVYDAFNKKLSANFGTQYKVIGLNWHSKSELVNLAIDERFSLLVDKEEVFTVIAEYSWSKDKSIAFKVTTPFSGYEKFGVKLVGSVSSPFHLEAKLILPNQEFKTTAILDLTDGGHVRGALTLPGLPAMELALQAAGNARNYKFEATAQFGTKRFSTLLHWNIEDELFAKLRIETPSSNLRLLEIHGQAARKEDSSLVQAGFSLNDYSNEIKLSKTATSKGLKMRLHFLDNLYELELNRLGDVDNRAVNLQFVVNGKKQIDVSTKLTSMFTNRAWKVRPPHSGFVEVKRLFGSAVEGSRLEWDFARISWQDVTIVLRADYKTSHFRQRVSVRPGELSFKMSTSLPRFNIDIKEISASAKVTKINRHEIQINVALSGPMGSYKLTGITNRQNSIHLHVSGLKNVNYVKKESLTLQAHLIRSDGLRELSLKLFGLEQGDMVAVLSTKVEKTQRQASIGLSGLGTNFEASFNSRTHKNWLSAIVDRELEGKIKLSLAGGEVHSASWSSKANSAKVEADLQVQSSALPEDQPVRAKIVVLFQNGLLATVDGNAFGEHAQVQIKLGNIKLEAMLARNGAEIFNLIASSYKEGYRSKVYNQRLHILYMKQMVFKFDSKHEVINWRQQVAGSVELQVVEKGGKVTYKWDTESRIVNIDLDITGVKTIKLAADLNSYSNPKIHMIYGTHEVLARMQHMAMGEKSFKTEFTVSNPWMPVSVKLHHEHNPGKHRIQHEYSLGNTQYKLDSHLLTEQSSVDAKLYFKSPEHELQAKAFAAVNAAFSRFSHTVQYNGKDYLKVDASMESTASDTKEFESRRNTNVNIVTGFTRPVSVELQHHYNKGWRHSTWHHKVVCGSGNAQHTGRIHWGNGEVSSHLTYLEHENEVKIGQGHYLLRHTQGSTNVGQVAGTYSRQSCSLTFSSDLTDFHTNTRLSHHIGRNEGSISFEQTGSIPTPKVSGNWNLNRPNLRGELKVDTTHITLEHVHKSNKDFSCHYKVSNGESNHEVKASFNVRELSGTQYRTEINGHASFDSTASRPFGVRLQHQHNDWKDHSCQMKVIAGDWKVLHKSVMNHEATVLDIETRLNSGDASLFYHKSSIRSSQFSTETNLNGVSLYKLEGQHNSDVTKVTLLSDHYNIDSNTEINHGVQSWRMGKLSVVHSGLLPKIQASANWDLLGEAKKINGKINRYEIDLSANNKDGKVHYRHQVELGFSSMHVSGVYDPTSPIRMTEANLRVTSTSSVPRVVVSWEHKCGQKGFVKLFHSQGDVNFVLANSSWDFSESLRATVSVHTPLGQAYFHQTSATAVKISVIRGVHNVTGVLNASSTWKSGALSLQNGEPLLLRGEWNIEGVEKKASLEVRGGFKLNMEHKHSSKNEFSFNHVMTCDSCLLSNVLPSVAELKGAVTAVSNFTSGRVSGSVTINSKSPLAIRAGWNVQNTDKVIEIVAPMVSARFAHQHRSFKDFSFKHRVTVMSKTYSVLGGLQVEPPSQSGRQMKAYFQSANCHINLRHQIDASRKHSWNHNVQVGEWRVGAEGHHHRGVSLQSGVVFQRATEQLATKNITWSQERFEYEDSVMGVKYHHLQLVNTDIEKAAWFKSLYYHKVVGTGVSLKRTCLTCYQLEMRAASRGTPNLLAIDAQLHAQSPVVMINANVETPNGKLFVNNKFEGQCRNFLYTGSVGTGSGKLEAKAEVRMESADDIKVKANWEHKDLLSALPNHQSGFVLTQTGNSWRSLNHFAEVTVDDWKPLSYNSRIAVISTKKWAVEVALNENMTPLRRFEIKAAFDRELNASLKWMENSFVNIKADASYRVELRSSCPVVPHLAVALRLQRLPQKFSVKSEIQLGDKVIQGSFALGTGVQKMIDIQVKTPFRAVSQISTSISVSNKVTGKFSAHASFEVNELRYTTALNSEKESSMGVVPRGFISWKAETPHRGFSKVQILVQSKDNSARLAANINDMEFSLAGNVTANLLSIRASLPIPGYERIGLKVLSDEDESVPRLRILLKLPHGHFVKATVVGTIKLQQFHSSLIDARVVIETSFSKVKNVEVDLGHGFKDGRFKHTSGMIIDGQRWHRLNFNGSREEGEIIAEYNNPIRINYQLRLGPVRTAELKITYKDSVPFHLNTRIHMDGRSLSGKSFITLRTPYRTVYLSREVKLLPRGFTFKLEFTPNQQTTKPLVLTIQSLNKSDYYKTAASSTVSLTVPTRRIEASIEVEKSRGKAELTTSLNWDASKASSDKTVHVKMQTEFSSNEVSGRLNLQLANKKPYTVSFTTQMHDRQVVFSNRVELDITDNKLDTIVIEMRAVRSSVDATQITGKLFQYSSKVDLKLEGQMKSTDAQKDVRISVEYVGTDGQPKKMQSVVLITQDSIRLDMTSPTRQCNFELSRARQSGSAIYTLTTHGKTFELRLQSASPDVEFVYQPRQNDRVSAAIGYPNKRHLRVDIHRTTDQVKMQHLLVEVELKSRHLLKTRVNWNPTYALLHYSTLRDRLPSMYTEASAFVNSVRFACVQDLMAKLNADLVLPDLTSAAQLISEEMQPLRQDLSYLSGHLEEMYMRNEFYSRDICRFVRKTTSAVTFYTGAAARYSYDRASQVYRGQVQPHVRWAMTEAGKLYDWSHGRVRHAYGLYRNHADKLNAKINQHVLRYINAGVDGIRPTLSAVHDGLQSALSAYSSFHTRVIRHPVVQKFHSRIVRSIGMVNFQSLDQLQGQLRESAMSTHQYVEGRIAVVSEHTANVIGGVKSRLREGLNSIMENRHAQFASSLVSGAYEQSKWFLDHFNIEQGLKDFAKDNYLQAVEYLRQNSIGLATDYLGLSKNEIIENKIENGRFEANLYSPMAWNDLQSLPTSGLEEVKGRLASSYTSVRNSYNTVRRKLNAVRDVVYDSIPDFDMPSGSWIPKFKGVASVVGEHVVTFDGRHYDFRGSDCSYLLARDFRGRGWAISMTYSRAGKSVDIHAYGKRITITPRLHVVVDGAQKELPFSLGNFSIVRTASGLHAKDLDHLFTLFVDPEADSHMISVSGWYHGRLGGLLGNFDNEPFNDMIGNDGLRTDDLLRFTRSWKLGACRHTNLASGGHDNREHPHPECERLFGSPRSPFKRCYSYADPAPFLEICAQERRSNGGQQMCKAAVAYMRHCAAKGLRGLQAPVQCMRCDLRSGSGYRQLLAGQKNALSTTGTSADVVLVLEERGCIGRETLRKLPALVAQMERSLTAAGVTDVHFSLLGFGNPKHHHRGNLMATRGRAHWHTMSGELTGNADQLSRAIATIDTHDVADTGAETRADALDAVRLAARFAELRPSAARHVVLVTCDECHEGRRTLQSVQRDLDESGVQLHLMTELQMPTYFYGRRRSQAFGVDATKAFSAESPNGSAALHGYTRQPAGKCARLAKATGGAAFDLRYLRRTQYFGGSQAAQFSRAFADRLAASSARPAEQDCRCTASACGQRSRLRCHTVA